MAKRLAKIGCNIVRFHQLDSEWHTPNIFQYTKAKRLSTTMELDPESMKHLDYLIYCLKREGIYVYMDIFTYRKFKAGDGVENTIALGDAAKPYSSYNRRLIDLQKKFAYDFWNHLNPYTGLAHKDDPVFVMGEIVNESDLFSRKIEVDGITLYDSDARFGRCTTSGSRPTAIRRTPSPATSTTSWTSGSTPSRWSCRRSTTTR